jgi:hypothetical protein
MVSACLGLLVAGSSLAPASAAELRAGSGLATYQTSDLNTSQECTGLACGTDLLIDLEPISNPIASDLQIDNPQNSANDTSNPSTSEETTSSSSPGR